MDIEVEKLLGDLDAGLALELGEEFFESARIDVIGGPDGDALAGVGLGLRGREELPVRVLSAGQKRRVLLARTVVVEGCEVRFASPEYVILRKLEYYREGGSEKHLRDIEGILAVSGDLVNVDEIETRAEFLGVRPQWEALQARRMSN